MARLWRLYSSCLLEHQTCAETHLAPSSAPWLPTRLIDLSECRTTGMVSLVSGCDLSTRTIYMTLSHTWGAKPCLKLTTLTRNTLAAGLRIKALPLTFREACFVALELQCNHIWIDSLCIIQDSEADWLHESSLMASVYANSSLTIAASAAEDSHSGLFQRRDLGRFLASIDFRCHCGSASYDATEQSAEAAGTAWYEKLPLHRRAWVHQELAISRRIAYFADVQIIWICLETVAGELDSMSAYFNQHMYAPYLRPVIPQYDMSWLSSCVAEIPLSWKWTRLVASYSDLNLTYAKDRLVAVAGMARLYHNHSQGSLGKYCAGLWEQSLAHDLIWRRTWPFDSLARSTNTCDTYPAPTWSWAYSDGPVVWGIDLGSCEEYQDERMLDVVKVDVRPVSDPFGAVRKGHIRLVGCMVRIAAHPRDTEPGPTSQSVGVAFDDLRSSHHVSATKPRVLYLMPVWKYIA